MLNMYNIQKNVKSKYNFLCLLKLCSYFIFTKYKKKWIWFFLSTYNNKVYKSKENRQFWGIGWIEHQLK